MSDELAQNTKPTTLELFESLDYDDKQFLLTYLVNGYNGVQAALATWRNLEYNSAKTKAWEKLTNPDLITTLQAAYNEKVMPAEEALARLSSMGRADIGELFEDGVLLPFDELTKRGVSHWVREYKETADYLNGERDDENLMRVVREIKLHDSKDALKSILTAHGKLIDKLEISGAVHGATVNFYLPEKEVLEVARNARS